MKAIDILIEKAPKLSDLVQQAINEETSVIGNNLFSTQTELLLTKEENTNLGEQLFELQSKLILGGII